MSRNPCQTPVASASARLSRIVLPCLVVLVGLGLAGVAVAQPIYVNAGALGGNGTCGQPFGTLTAALAAAEAGGVPAEIRLAGSMAGLVYPEPAFPLFIDFSNVTLKGGYDPATLASCNHANIETARDAGTLITVLDAAGTSRILAIEPERDASDNFVAATTGIEIDRVTFRNGMPAASGSGGALFILNSEVAISNSTFRDNRSRDHFFGGGAIFFAGYAAGGVSREARLDLTGNLFEGNQTHDGVAGSGPGGAILAFDANIFGSPPAGARLTELHAVGNVFRTNIAHGSGPLPTPTYCDAGPNDPNMQDCNGDGIGDTCISNAFGGAAYLENILGTWQGNVFDANEARSRPGVMADYTGRGGGVFTSASQAPYQGNPDFLGNTFRNNVATTGFGSPAGCGWYAGWGGGAYLAGYDGEFSGNLLESNRVVATGNTAPLTTFGGGLMLFPEGRPVIDSNTFRGNRLESGNGSDSAWGGGALVIGGQAVITRNLFEANVAAAGSPFGAMGGGLYVYRSTGAFTIVAGNTLQQNIAQGINLGGQISGLGGGARLEISSPDALIADNVVRQNSSTEIVAGLGFAGLVISSWTGGPAVLEPRIQNNLVTDNQGHGLTLWGLSTGHVSPFFVHNTMANNRYSGLAMNRGDGLVFDSSILYGNDTAGAGFGDVFDGFLTEGGAPPIASPGVTVRYSALGTLPPDPAPPDAPSSFRASALDPDNQNFISENPQFINGYYLRQDPDDGPPHSRLVDAVPHDFSVNWGLEFDDRTRMPGLALLRGFGPLRAGQPYDLDGDTVADTMSDRTTRRLDQSPDIFFADIGYHYPLGAPVVDSDGDGIPDADEIRLGLDQNDADTDNDGIPDGLEAGPVRNTPNGPISLVNARGLIPALDCDWDNDGLSDGTEVGITVPHPDTDTTAACGQVITDSPCYNPALPAPLAFRPDADPTTRTDPTNPDTDGGGALDGCEDLNQDGRCFPCGDRCIFDLFPVPGQETPHEQDPQGQADDDGDLDCLSYQFELFLGTSPFDADSDNDGIPDGEEIGLRLRGVAHADWYQRWVDPANDPNFPGLSPFALDPSSCDTDGDLLPDGVEAGMTGPVPAAYGGGTGAVGTDVTARCYPGFPQFHDPSAGPHNPTHPAVDDTDGDGCLDGEEDANRNGVLDAGETDPRDPGDCAGGGLTVRMNTSVTALGGGASACGPPTVPAIATVLDQRGNCVRSDDVFQGGGCPSFRIAAGPQTVEDAITPGGSWFRPMPAAALVFIELSDCSYSIRVQKSGTDLEVIALP